MTGTVLELVEDDKLQTVMVATALLLLWGFAYIHMINRRLFSFFSETNFYCLLGVTIGMTLSKSLPIRNVMSFFLCFDNYDSNILVFSILYPVSKLCTHVYGDNMSNALLEAVLVTSLSILLHSVAIFAAIWYYPDLVSPGIGSSPFRHMLFALFLSTCGSIFDPYLAVHNSPEVRTSSFVRGYLMSQRVFTLCFGLDLRRLILQLAMYSEISPQGVLLIITKHLIFIPVESVVVGVSAGFVSTFVTRHSMNLHIHQEVVVMPCVNYLVYAGASRFGLSAAWSVLACEFVQGKLTLQNVNKGGRATYKATLANLVKMTIFFYFLATGFFFAAPENRFLWKYVSIRLFLAAFAGTIVLKGVACYILIVLHRSTLGRTNPEKSLSWQLWLQTRSTPCMISLFNMHHFTEPFGVCLAQMLQIQWTLFLVCTMLNLMNVPLATKRLEVLIGTSGARPGSSTPLLRTITFQLLEDLHHEVCMFAGDPRWLPAYLEELSKSFDQHLLAGLMVKPEDRSGIMSAYKSALASQSNFLDRLRKSVKPRSRLQATQVCANFFVKNLLREGFTFEEIFNYF